MTIYLDSLYLTIVQKSKFLTNHNAAQQTRFMSLDETFAEGLSFVCMIVRRCIVRTLDGISHINVGFLLGFAPAARRREPAAGGSSAGGCTNPASVPSTGDGTSTSIGAKQCTTPVSNPLLCARICYLTAPTRTSLSFVFTTNYGCMMCKFQIYIASKCQKFLVFCIEMAN